MGANGNKTRGLQQNGQKLFGSEKGLTRHLKTADGSLLGTTELMEERKAEREREEIGNSRQCPGRRHRETK